MKMYIDLHGLNEGSSVFHLAPERGLYNYIGSRTENYITGDIDIERYSHIPDIKQIDLCQPETYQDIGKFDLVIHSHVIEHVPCNYTAVMIRLHRLLSSNGIHMFSVPIYGRAFEEDLGEMSAETADRRFGQFDHLRRFSSFDLQRTLGAIFAIPDQYSLLTHFSEQALQKANVPEEAWVGYTGHSVFCMTRDDLRL